MPKKGHASKLTDSQIGDALARSVIENDLMEERASYLTRGRSFAELTDTELQAAFAEAFHALVREQTPDTNRLVGDLGAELGLRGLEPDASRLETAVREAAEVIRRDRQEHPEGHPAVRAKIRDYLEKSKGRPN